MKTKPLALADLSQKQTRAFWAKVDKSAGPCGCWLWTGNKTRNGYGMTAFSGRHAMAHRAAFVLSGQIIPDGLTLDHLCRVTLCVNPAHLEPCTSRENTLRGDSPTALNARRDACVNGHPFVAGNMRRLGPDRRYRRCTICERAAGDRYRARLAARALLLSPVEA